MSLGMKPLDNSTQDQDKVWITFRGKLYGRAVEHVQPHEARILVSKLLSFRLVMWFR